MRCTMNLMRFWISATSPGSVVWRSFTRAPASSIRSIALSGRKRSEIAIGVGDGEVDGLVRVTDRVEFLVPVLDAVDDLDGVFFVGRRNFDGLEAALKGAVFLDGLTVFSGRGGADALDLTA